MKRIIYDQLYEYAETFLNKLLCGFRKAHSTQHALFRLLQEWQKELDSSGIIDDLFMGWNSLIVIGLMFFKDQY